MEVSVRELKDHLSEYLRRAQAGEEIVVTSHGKPVGRLVGFTPADRTAETEEGMLARLRAMPGIRAGDGKPLHFPEHPLEWRSGQKTLSDLVLDDRE